VSDGNAATGLFKFDGLDAAGTYVQPNDRF